MTMLKLDERDIRMLAVLAREGRISKAELAQRVNLSATPCWQRLKRLEKSGIISGYHAEIELRLISPHVSVFVMAELDNHKAATLQIFEAAVSRYEEITGCWSLGGGFDYLLQVIARDIDHYQRMIDELLSSQTGLARYFTYIVTKPIKNSAPPLDLLVANER